MSPAEARQVALDHAVRMACSGCHGNARQAVEAAEMFRLFLLGESTHPEHVLDVPGVGTITWCDTRK